VCICAHVLIDRPRGQSHIPIVYKWQRENDSKQVLS
jgi:hypothetical protein